MFPICDKKDFENFLILSMIVSFALTLLSRGSTWSISVLFISGYYWKFYKWKKPLAFSRISRRPWKLRGLGMNHARTTPFTNSHEVLPRPPAPRDRPRGFLVLASSADALENCELTVTFEAFEKPEILEIVDRGMVVNLTLSTQILNWTRKNKGTIVKISKYGVSIILYVYIYFFSGIIAM